MSYVIRTARKDLYSRFSGKLIAKKGEQYLDKGFGQIEQIPQEEKVKIVCRCGDHTINSDGVCDTCRVLEEKVRTK